MIEFLQLIWSYLFMTCRGGMRINMGGDVNIGVLVKVKSADTALLDWINVYVGDYILWLRTQL